MKIVRHIPNFITSLNLLCGAVGVVFSFNGRPDLAFALMLAASAFDFLDGFCARLLGAYSEMGRELDSLSDLVSFGLLPSVMLFNLMRSVCSPATALPGTALSWYLFLPLLLVVGSGLRLAKFNVDARQEHGFLGLPTPACALLCGSLCLYAAAVPAGRIALWCASPWFIPSLVLLLCALLLSEIPMFSMKFSREDAGLLKAKRIIFVLGAACIIAAVVFCHAHWSLAVLLIFVFYLVKNLIYAAFRL